MTQSFTRKPWFSPVVFIGHQATVHHWTASECINLDDNLTVVREAWGPYGDPQHPYFYEEEDVWMAPGFINQFYEVCSSIIWGINFHHRVSVIAN